MRACDHAMTIDEGTSGKYVWYLSPLLHLIKFKVNKAHVALEVHFTVSAIQVI